MPPEEDRATANMHKNLVKSDVWFRRCDRAQTHTHRHRQTDRQTDTFITILFSAVGGGVKIKTSDAHDAMNLGALKAAIRHEVQKTRKVITTTFQRVAFEKRLGWKQS